MYPDNDAPYYDKVPKVKAQNYINRIFIDLIGREPFDAEMTAEEDALRATNFSIASREVLITKLQTDSTYIPGDSSYKYAYYNRFYELCKARVLEAATNGDIMYWSTQGRLQSELDSMAGDTIAYKLFLDKVRRGVDVINSEHEYRRGTIEIKDIFARMLYNAVYDQIWMLGYKVNAFNFLNASFNDLFYRYPARAPAGASEYEAGEKMYLEKGTAVLFGKSGQNKGDYIDILVNSDEFYECVIRWMYSNLLQREPTSVEVNTHMQTFFTTHDIQKLQLDIMKTDEYANF